MACSSNAARRILDYLITHALCCGSRFLFLMHSSAPYCSLRNLELWFGKHVVAHRSIYQKPIICSAEWLTTAAVHPALTMTQAFNY